LSYDVTKIPTSHNALCQSLVILNPELTTKTKNIQSRLSLSSKVICSLKKIIVAKARRKLMNCGPPMQEKGERRE